MSDSSSLSDSPLKIEIGKLNVLEPKLPISYNQLKLVRALVLGAHVFIIMMLLYVQREQKLSSLSLDFTIWITALSAIYFLVVIMRDTDREPTTKLSGYFQALWVFVSFALTRALLFDFPLQQIDGRGHYWAHLAARGLLFLAVYFDFIVNKLLIQKTWSCVIMMGVVSAYCAGLMVDEYKTNGNMPDLGIVDRNAYMSLLLDVFIVLAFWLIYVIVHRYKFEVVKKKAEKMTLRVVSLKD